MRAACTAEGPFTPPDSLTDSILHTFRNIGRTLTVPGTPLWSHIRTHRTHTHTHTNHQFNWADFVTLSHVETAIPQHRIAHYKYRGRLVWDKATRLDDVFGSTGGLTIETAMATIDAAAGPAAAAAPRELAAHGGGVYGPHRPHRPQREYPDDPERPNAFVCIRVTDGEVIGAARAAQQAALALDDRLAPGVIAPEKLHFTLLTLRLDTLADIGAATRVLRGAKALMQRYLPARTGVTVAGVGCFRDRVLHARPHPIDRRVLARFQAELRAAFVDAGLRLLGEHGEYTPHMTLLKFNREMSRTLGTLTPAAYSGYNDQSHFGVQPVDGIELCYMGSASDPDGFYRRFCPPTTNDHPDPATSWPSVEKDLDRIVRNNRVVVVLRGLPGSGKSTLARKIATKYGEEATVVCSADSFFVGRDGVYRFDRALLADAHGHSLHVFGTALHGPARCIIVDNTNTQPHEYQQRYLGPAWAAGWLQVVIETTCASVADLVSFERRGRHGVPMEALERMWDRWVPHRGALRVDFRDLAVARLTVPATVSTMVAVQGNRRAEPTAPGVLWMGQGTLPVVSTLFVFDFDKTLCNTAGKDEGQRAWEAANGKPFPKRNWFGSPESLRPPCPLGAGPALPVWNSCAGRSGSKTFILTGRQEQLRGELEIALGHLVATAPDGVIMKPDRSGHLSTAAWKVAQLRQLLAEHPQVTKVFFWDDEARNLAAAAALEAELRTAGGATLKVIDSVTCATGTSIQANKTWQPGSTVVRQFLGSRGLLRSNRSRANARHAVAFVAKAWLAVLEDHRSGRPGCHPDDFARCYGSHCFDREGDVDLCLLAPTSWPADKCIADLEKQLLGQGIAKLYVAHSSRCPILKVQMDFSNSGPCDLDIAFAAVLAIGVSPASIVIPARPLYESAAIANGTDGVAYAAHVRETLRQLGVAPSEFGMAIELAVTILKARHLKGNHYHCLRTVHLVEVARAALAALVPVTQAEPPAAEEIFRLLVAQAAAMTPGDWATCTAGFVAAQMLPMHGALWSEIHQTVRVSTALSIPMLEQMCLPEAYPGAGRCAVSLRPSCTSSPVLAWQLGHRLRGRLPTSFRSLLDAGFPVMAGPDVLGTSSFSIPDSNAARAAVAAHTSKLLQELLPYRASGAVVDIATVRENVPIVAGEPLSASPELAAAIAAIRHLAAEPLREAAVTASIVLENLDSDGRFWVHRYCNSLGLGSISEGHGAARQVIVTRHR